MKLAQLIGTALLATRSSLDESPSVQPEVVSSLPAGPPGSGKKVLVVLMSIFLSLGDRFLSGDVKLLASLLFPYIFTFTYNYFKKSYWKKSKKPLSHDCKVVCDFLMTGNSCTDKGSVGPQGMRYMD